jgi:glycosyltransferase involved in cell wall biosynthesis
MKPTRVLIIAHGHPDFSRGGAEQAAYDEFQALKAMPGIEPCLLARAPLGMGHGGTPFSVHREPGEYLFHSDMDDFFRLSQPIKHLVWYGFRRFLEHLKPDVVHFHHYVQLGVELVSETRRTLPDAKILLTLHEFWAMCHREGLMMKTNQQLCAEASPRNCHGCFPDHSPEDFLLRNRFIQSHLSGVDHFITPSEFLRQRYIKWGLPADRIHMIENGQAFGLKPAQDPSGSHPAHHFAFFGQINRWKGLDVLLEAMRIVLERRPEDAPLPMLNIHGANLENQSKEVREALEEKLEDLQPHVQFHGPYRKQDLQALMDGIGWVIVPSVWWENSPLVIQEAFSLGRPVIASNIGGMAEKVHHNVDGLHFRARDPAALAGVLERALDDPELWPRLRAGIRRPPDILTQVTQILGLAGVKLHYA